MPGIPVGLLAPVREEITTILKYDEIRINLNRETVRPQKKWMEFFGEDMRVCGVNKKIVSDREKQKERIRVVDHKLHGMEAKIEKKKEEEEEDMW